ncbi:MAG: hypothetical protein ACOYO1_11275 [Bacteroidales bacterium]
MKKLIFLLFALSLLSCRVQKDTVIQKNDSLVYIETLRFDTITTPADSSWLKAYFKCDSLGNVYIAQMKDFKTNELNTQFNFENGILNYSTNRDEKKTLHPCVDRYINRRINTTLTVTKTIIKMSMFQKIFFWLGLISIVVFVIGAYLKFRK